jgi:hypothetical protein
MIPFAELPTTDGVYVLHLSEPLAHARGYTGWAADIARRVAEHLDVEACRRAGFHVASHRGSPLICAAIRAGRSVTVAQVYPGAIAASNDASITGTTRACVSSVAASARRGRASIACRSHARPVLLVGAGAPHSGGVAMRPSPYRFAYDIELVCSLCARPVASVRVRTPHTCVLLLHPLRCAICGGVAVQGDVTRVRLPEPIPARPRRGRPPKGLQGAAA